MTVQVTISSTSTIKSLNYLPINKFFVVKEDRSHRFAESIVGRIGFTAEISTRMATNLYNLYIVGLSGEADIQYKAFSSEQLENIHGIILDVGESFTVRRTN